MVRQPWEPGGPLFSGGLMRLQGKIIKWQNDKGFGFIEPINGMPDVFFHENYLLNQSRRPVVGDEISFEITLNHEGKKRAEKILFRGECTPRRSDNFFDFFYSSLSCTFLICIGGLVFLKKVHPVILFLYFLLSLITFLIYWHDKIKAKKREWRTPEYKLHFFSLIGGWPGALIAQRQLRHKSRKQSFQVVFYITVILNISAISFYSYFGSSFVNYDLFVDKFNYFAHEFSQNSQDKPGQYQKGPVYSWTNKEGKTVYSYVGFPSDETYRDGKIEWK